ATSAPTGRYGERSVIAHPAASAAAPASTAASALNLRAAHAAGGTAAIIATTTGHDGPTVVRKARNATPYTPEAAMAQAIRPPAPSRGAAGRRTSAAVVSSRTAAAAHASVGTDVQPQVPPLAVTSTAAPAPGASRTIPTYVFVVPPALPGDRGSAGASRR